MALRRSSAYLELVELGWHPGVSSRELYVAKRQRGLGDSACRVCGGGAVDGVCFWCSTSPADRQRMDELAGNALRQAMTDVDRKLG